MKKVNLFVVLFIFCLFLCSCKDKNQNDVKNDENQNQQNTNYTILLSDSSLDLSIGETYLLSALISPANSSINVSWSSSNENVATVDQNGLVSAVGFGSTIINATLPNNQTSYCTVKVTQKFGSLTGTITYKYNNYIGNRGDTGSKVYLVSKDVKQLPSEIALGIKYNKPEEKIYCLEVDGNGNYTFNNILVGEYYLVIISKNTNNNPSLDLWHHWGFDFYDLFTDEDKGSAKSTVKLHKIESTTVSILENQQTVFSHDFGITYM